MKKIYLIYIVFLIVSYSNAQIAAIDRANNSNTDGATMTGSIANVAASGLIRGPGVNQNASGSSFNSNNWTETSIANAFIAEDYIEWSIETTTGYSILLSSIDIDIDISATGPTSASLYYSYDDFNSSTQLTNLTLVDDGPVFNIPTTIRSGNGGKITFRLFAWGATNTSGTLDVESLGTSTLGIDDPGIIINGELIDAQSNIITSASFDPTDNIDYTTYTSTSGLTTTNAIKIGEFLLNDGGNDNNDPDSLPTILNSITLAVDGHENIAALAIFDSNGKQGETTNVTANTIINDLTVTANDNASQTFEVYATYNSLVIDNEQISLTVNETSVTGNSSLFASTNAGAATTPTTGDDNRIEVTAAQLAFTTQPSIVSLGSAMSPSPSVAGVDSNGNIDMDFTETLTITSNGDTASPSYSQSAVSGIASFNTIIHNTNASGLTLTATSSLGSASSSNFSVVTAAPQTIAIQDWDQSEPVWGFNNDVDTFGNGSWGSTSGGFYGQQGAFTTFVQLPSFPFFSETNPIVNTPGGPQPRPNNLFAGFDLDDEPVGNGTSGFATMTFASVDVSAAVNKSVSFKWESNGFNGADEIRYELITYVGATMTSTEVTLAGAGQPGTGGDTVTIPLDDNVTQVSLKIKVKQDGEDGFFGFDDFIVRGAYVGLIYTSGAWTPQTPDATTGSENAIILDGTPTFSSDVVLNNLTIVEGAGNGLILDENANLTINGNLNTGDNLMLCSTSTKFPSIIVNGTSTGFITYKRHVNTAFQNDLVSSPVIGDKFNSFVSRNPNLRLSPDGTEALFGPFNNNTATDNQNSIGYEVWGINLTDVLTSGIGYRTGRNAEYMSDNIKTFSFYGTVPTTSISTAVTKGSSTLFGDWNSVGNPYPSYYNALDFITTNQSIFEPMCFGMYGYDGATEDGWVVLNLNTANDVNITPGQGFLIAANNDGNITFNASARRVGTTDDFIPGRLSSQQTVNYNLKLKLTSGDQLYKTDLFFNDNSTLDLDPGYDAAAFGVATPTNFSIFTKLMQDSNEYNEEYLIQSLPLSALDNAIIPLGINAVQGQQLNVGIETSTLPEGIEVYLHDAINNTSTLLNTSNFALNTNTNLTGADRFSIRLFNSSLSNPSQDLESIAIYNVKKDLIISGYLSEKSDLKLIDIQGRTVINTTLNSNLNNHKISINTITPGVYVVQLKNNSNSVSKKIIIK